MKQWKDIYKNVLMLSQLGLSFITPLLLCLALCWLLTDKAGVGGWVYILGFFFGLGGSFMTAYKFYLSTVRQEEMDKCLKKKKFSSNKHL